ncbi:MAG: hypothetical protein AVDCRST_MAG65-648, partial [uncultured Solirubrobacteraceae bacterium]
MGDARSGMSTGMRQVAMVAAALALCPLAALFATRDPAV